MAGNFRTCLVMSAMASIVVAQNQGCVEKLEPADGLANSVRIQEVLSGVGPHVVLPALERFSEALQALDSATRLMAEDLAAGLDGATAKQEAQERWLDATTIWQELEVMQVGPAASSVFPIEGRDLRDEIYSWPTVSACRIDQRTADETWVRDDYFEQNLVNSYGLDALEHLLFAGSSSACPSQVVPVSDGSWDELGGIGIATNRAQFALVLSAGLLTQADELKLAWSPEGENFSGALGTAGDGIPYVSPVEALNQLTNAMFYLEKTTKDRKLAQPMGMMNCAATLCLGDIEGLASESALLSVRSNLVGFQQMFTGGVGPGLDDLLEEAGHGDLAIQIVADLEATIGLADAIDGPLEAALVEHPEAVQALYDSLCLVTDALKYDIMTVFSLEIPSEAAGDND